MSSPDLSLAETLAGNGDEVSVVEGVLLHSARTFILPAPLSVLVSSCC